MLNKYRFHGYMAVYDRNESLMENVTANMLYIVEYKKGNYFLGYL